MKNKVAIVTITGNNNYGNRLQNYALQETLRKLGCSVETLRNYGDGKSIMAIKTRFRYLYALVTWLLKRSGRRKKFEDFDRKYINFSKRNYLQNNRNNFGNKYDCYIAGSDQIWNPYFPENADNNYLAFAGRENSISYAASFGSDNIPDERREEISNYLREFKAISVRENEGKIIAEELTGRDDIVVSIDPTMLLAANEWLRIAKKPRAYHGEKYILCYFLGQQSDGQRKNIEKAAEEKGYCIINVLDRENRYFNTGPSEFLWLVQHAQLICTDSFHACVFAMIFRKPLIAFKRTGEADYMYSRIQNLIKTFKIEKCEYDGKKIVVERIETNYDNVDEILRSEQRKSIDYLKKALEIKVGEIITNEK